MTDSTEDRDAPGATEEPPREWDTPELEVIPMQDAMTGVLPPDPSNDAPFGYS